MDEFKIKSKDILSQDGKMTGDSLYKYFEPKSIYLKRKILPEKFKKERKKLIEYLGKYYGTQKNEEKKHLSFMIWDTLQSMYLSIVSDSKSKREYPETSKLIRTLDDKRLDTSDIYKEGERLNNNIKNRIFELERINGQISEYKKI